MTSIALSTDLYELTMLAGYYRLAVEGRASFELYVRELPDHRSYLVAAGLEQALEYLEHFQFMPPEIEYLRRLPNLQAAPRAFFDDYLPALRFTGDVAAVGEGTPVFAHEPLLQVTAPVAEAQIVETALLALITFPTSVASKAARVVDQAAGRQVMEFGSRRAHGLEAAKLAARAAYLAGCASTSNVDAGFSFGIPVSGTMAHSWVMAFADEMAAFHAYFDLYGERSVFLIDTYDTLIAARRIAASGLRPAAIRIDSGDIVETTRGVRTIFDEAGLQATKILVSGDLDEYRLAELLAAGAPIDGFGVGTAISTAKDAPALGGVYKLVEIERGGSRVPVLKRSPGKRSYPGRKQVWRMYDGGQATGDILGLSEETPPAGGVPLLETVMEGGRRTAAGRPLQALKERCLAEVGALPAEVRRLADAKPYAVHISAGLDELAARMLQERRT
jgi:nicotinate phosphoribosyltransferase